MTTVGELFPRFCEELQDLISSAGRCDLVDQVRTLPVVGRCTCGQSNCAHFYTAEHPAGSYGSGRSNVLLNADSGFVALDVQNETIVGIEILDRPDVKESLIEAQHAALARYPIETCETDGVRRSPMWRPLDTAEIALATAQRDERSWMNPQVAAPDETYWFKAPT
jgi:hypothetical protein